MPMFYYFDPLYFLFALPGLLIALFAQAKVKSNYSKYSQVFTQNNITGADAAREILQRNGIFDVEVKRISGNLTDNFNPKDNTIYLSDDADTVWSKVKSMYTDPTHLNVSDPGHVEGNAVFTYLDAFSCDQDFADFWPEFKNLDELKAAYTAGGIGDMKCKKLLNNVINRMLDPIRARRHEYEQDIPEIFNILKKGSESARETAAQTMSEVRKAMQIDYFNDAALIQQQAEKFKK